MSYRYNNQPRWVSRGTIIKNMCVILSSKLGASRVHLTMLWCYWWRSWVWWSIMTAVRNETRHRLMNALWYVSLISKGYCHHLIILAMSIGERYPLICLWSHHGGDRTTVYFARLTNWRRLKYGKILLVCILNQDMRKKVWYHEGYGKGPALSLAYPSSMPWSQSFTHTISLYFDISFVLVLSFRGYSGTSIIIISSYSHLFRLAHFTNTLCSNTLTPIHLQYTILIVE